tara:strand:+ start:7760 stop:9103 length:1344 start_codon:yes stop_codon:yes gene_type:complete
MFIREFNPDNKTKIDKINKFLSEQFGVQITASYPKKAKLEQIREMSDMAIIKLKGTSKHFQLEPEYAKYLGIKDVIDTMLTEGMYAESPAYMEMKNMLIAEVQNLMDGGCKPKEAVSQCMHSYRKNPQYSYSDEHVLPIIMMAANEYMEAHCKNEAVEEDSIEESNTELNEYLLSELAKEMGIDLNDHDSMDAIEEKLDLFAEVSGKSRDSVIGFLNGLEEDAISNGIKFFGAKVAQHKTNEDKYIMTIAQGAIDGKKEVEIDGEKEPVKMSKEKAEEILGKKAKKESMFDDIIDDMLSEELEGTSVEEAEVVMAVRALADDIQDHVERLGRMVNEDIPAIADQMIHEFGADKASQFKDSAENTLSQALESAKQAKDGVNELVGSITGEDISLGGSDAIGDLGDEPSDAGSVDDALADLPDDMDMDVNEPAAAGPEEEPLGRAPVEV